MLFIIDFGIVCGSVLCCLGSCLNAMGNGVRRGERDEDTNVSIASSSQVTPAEPVATVTTPLLPKTEV